MNLRTRLRDSKLGYLMRLGASFVRLPNYIVFFETHISTSKEQAAASSAAADEHHRAILEKLEVLQKNFDALDGKVSDLKHQRALQQSESSATSNHTTINSTMSDDHTHDRFYKAFEDKFRGSEDMIKDRLQEYAPYLQSLSDQAKSLPVLDMGCGRGEFLDVIQQNGLKAVGIDMNKTMVERAKSLGYEAYEDDALSYLLKQKSSSLGAISGFHLIEHIPFPALLKIFEECYRVVHPDGFVLFETPNPKNLQVGTANFYLDPSHIKPLPPELTAFALATNGFHTQTLSLHPIKDEIDHSDDDVKGVLQLIYGPRDYAVLASKKPFKVQKSKSD